METNPTAQVVLPGCPRGQWVDGHILAGCGSGELGAPMCLDSHWEIPLGGFPGQNLTHTRVQENQPYPQLWDREQLPPTTQPSTQASAASLSTGLGDRPSSGFHPHPSYAEMLTNYGIVHLFTAAYWHLTSLNRSLTHLGEENSVTI